MPQNIACSDFISGWNFEITYCNIAIIFDVITLVFLSLGCREVQKNQALHKNPLSEFYLGKQLTDDMASVFIADSESTSIDEHIIDKVNNYLLKEGQQCTG